MAMSETELVDQLEDAFSDMDLDWLRRVGTFEDAGLMTRNKVLVLTLDDGSEFQLTVVQSRRARDE
jgi:hypothetical protein